MKRLLLSSMLIACTNLAMAQVKMPAASPTQTLKQDFALGNIEIVYSRPAMKGRKIVGDLVPLKEVWRTGANGATTIEFSEAVEIKGKKIDAGKYALYTIPQNEDDWTIILNKGVKNWGTTGYTESDDVARFDVKSKKIKDKIESFTIEIADVMPASCNLEIKWNEFKLELPIQAYKLTDRIKADLDKAMTPAKMPYWQAAQFYTDYENNNAKSLEYINLAVKDNPKAFYMWLYKARLEAKMGNKAAAMASANTSLSLAKDAKNADYVKMNEDLLKELK